jgi:hypothetical protein
MAKFICTENETVVVETNDENFIAELRKHFQYKELVEEEPVKKSRKGRNEEEQAKEA